MIRIWGKIIKDNRIVKNKVAVSNIEGDYQEKLKLCIIELCEKLDISKPYWLPSNMEEYNRRYKTSFTFHNFIEDIDFDKFTIEELKEKKRNKS